MFNADTVLVLGAGASCGYGFPLGHGLIDDLIRTAHIWKLEQGNIAGAAADLERLLRFYDPISIDAFLTHYSESKELIACAKRRSHMFF